MYILHIKSFIILICVLMYLSVVFNIQNIYIYIYILYIKSFIILICVLMYLSVVFNIQNIYIYIYILYIIYASYKFRLC